VVSSGALVLGSPAVADPVMTCGVAAAVFDSGCGEATQAESTAAAAGSTNRSTAARAPPPPEARRRPGFVISIVLLGTLPCPVERRR